MSLSALVFITGMVISLCFAAAVLLDTVRKSGKIEGLLYGFGMALLIWIVGFLITTGVGNWFRMGEPPSSTIQVTITPEAR